MVAIMETRMTRIEGWKAISTLFNRSIAWCKRWAVRTDGKRIPVRWVAGRPEMYAEDVVPWRRRVTELKPTARRAA
jgi:hypothetical protein